MGAPVGRDRPRLGEVTDELRAIEARRLGGHHEDQLAPRAGMLLGRGRAQGGEGEGGGEADTDRQ